MVDKISGIFKSAGTKLIVILGLAGMALILFSDFIIPDKEAVKQEAASDDVLTDYESYVKEMEQRLKTTLEKIDGVGKADVMITAAGSGEYIYAKDEKVDTDSESVSKDEIIGGNGQKQALVRKIGNPEISGVVVVCEGGESSVVKEKVYNAVAAAFNIPSQKIFVAGSK